MKKARKRARDEQTGATQRSYDNAFIVMEKAFDKYMTLITKEHAANEKAGEKAAQVYVFDNITHL